MAKFIGFALNTMLPLLVVRYLTQESVGVYRQAFLVASNAVLVLPLGFSMSAYYFLNRDPEKRSAAVLNILLFNLSMGAVVLGVFTLFPGLLGAAFQSQELARLAPAIGILIFLWIFASFLETAPLALQEARLAAIFIVGSQLIKTAMMIAAVIFFHSVDSLIYAAIALFGVQAVALVAFLHSRFPRFWSGFDPAFFRTQFSYSVPFGLSVLLYVVQTDVHNYFVSHSFSAADFAIYSVGCFQLPLVAMLYESVGAVMIPRMSQMQDEGRKREMLEMAANATHRLALVYFPLFAFLMIFATEFITTLFTKDYAASVPIFRVNLAILPLFCLVVDPITRAYPVAGRFLLKVRVAICMALLAIFWAGLGRFGLIEMISIVVAAILFEKLMCTWISARMLDATPRDAGLLAPIGRVAAATAVAASVVTGIYFVGASGLAAASSAAASSLLAGVGGVRLAEFVGGCLFLGIFFAAFAAIYIPAAVWIGAVGSEDKERILGMMRRFKLGRSVEHKTVA